MFVCIFDNHKKTKTINSVVCLLFQLAFVGNRDACCVACMCCTCGGVTSSRAVLWCGGVRARAREFRVWETKKEVLPG